MFWGLMFSLAWSALTSTGCTSMMPAARTPETRIIHTREVPILAYRKSLSTAIAMGTAITQADQQALVWQGTLRNVVVLTGEVRTNQEGSIITVTATILPNKLAIGSFTEPDEFVRAYSTAR